jgi:hypothetical protein
MSAMSKNYLIEVLLPVGRDARATLSRVRDDLTKVFGGVTMHVNAPAEGLWESEGDVDQDSIVMVQVMTSRLDRGWWQAYRRRLEADLAQKEIVIRASEIQRL